MIDRVSGIGGQPAPVAPVRPAAPGGAAAPAGDAAGRANPFPASAAQLVEARLMQALLTPGGVKALSDADLATLTEIVARTNARGSEGMAAPGQPLPPGYAQISPERAAELLARVDPAALHRAHGIARARGLGAGDGAGQEDGVIRDPSARLIRWIALACLAAMGLAFLLWVRG